MSASPEDLPVNIKASEEAELLTGVLGSNFTTHTFTFDHIE